MDRILKSLYKQIYGNKPAGTPTEQIIQQLRTDGHVPEECIAMDGSVDVDKYYIHLNTWYSKFLLNTGGHQVQQNRRAWSPLNERTVDDKTPPVVLAESAKSS